MVVLRLVICKQHLSEREDWSFNNSASFVVEGEGKAVKQVTRCVLGRVSIPGQEGMTVCMWMREP